MKKNKLFSDSKKYHPAAIFIIDLEKHSLRKKSEIRDIQGTMENIFALAIKMLDIDEIKTKYTSDGYILKYTGDGYIFTFLGASSARIMDFINITIPRLSHKLKKHKQSYRAGIDYGFVRLKKNSITNEFDHFELPGIQAARLEQAAKSKQILCTNVVYLLFKHLYPKMFSSSPQIISTKDRDLMVYELFPIEYKTIQRLVSEYLFPKKELKSNYFYVNQNILIVDDEESLLNVMTELLQHCFPKCKVFSAKDGIEALELFRSYDFKCVLADIRMPRMDGIEMMEKMLQEKPTQKIIVLTGHGDLETSIECIRLGAHDYLLKPIALRDLIKSLKSVSLGELKKEFEVIGENIELVIFNLKKAKNYYEKILSLAHDSKDIAHTMLRHKTKQLMINFIKYIQPGYDVNTMLLNLITQLEHLVRMGLIINKAGKEDLNSYIVSFINDVKKLYPNVTIDLNIDLNGSSKFIIRSSTIVTLIVCELIDNAIYATSKSGKIVVSYFFLKSTGFLHITVQDSGPGISKKDIDRIYDEGFSTKGAGRGLGLNLVITAAHSLGGEIKYEYNKGALFSVVIPTQ